MKYDAWTRSAAGVALILLGTISNAQVPDLLNAFEMGGRAMGMGGGTYSNSSDPSASYWNPAGLAHISSTTVQMDFRNRPGSDTSVSGSFVDPDRSADGQYGSNAITFAGVATPFGKGVLGLSYAVGGWIRDDARNDGDLHSGDPGDPTVVTTFIDFLKVYTEFVTLAYGTGSGRGTTFGVGIVFARQNLNNDVFVRTEDGSGGLISETLTEVSSNGFGLGGIVGVQFVPPSNPNVSFGLSYRSEIQLNDVEDGEPYGDTIPARLQAGLVFRRDGLRGGRDYLVGGIDASYFFPANDGRILERDSQLAFGGGVEYNWSQAFGYIPFRVGFRSVQEAGEGFANRDVFTFGVGYRPTSGDWTIDLSIATASGQSRPDLAISMTFFNR